MAFIIDNDGEYEEAVQELDDLMDEADEIDLDSGRALEIEDRMEELGTAMEEYEIRTDILNR